jgi:hypothetical protein
VLAYVKYHCEVASRNILEIVVARVKSNLALVRVELRT